MRSRKSHTISSGQIHQWALSWLQTTLRLPDHGWKCTAVVVWNVVLRAAARMTSLAAACADLAHGPTDDAVIDALQAELPRTARRLETRLAPLFTDHLPRRLRRRSWTVAIDWHLVPYYGQPYESINELYRSRIFQGTANFHAYATACIVSHGVRYTLAVTWVRRGQSTVKVLARLLDRMAASGLKIRRLLLDRAFYAFPVWEFLQSRKIPFLMPAALRGRKPKRNRRRTGLRRLRQQPAGRYSHTAQQRGKTVAFSVVVAYRSYRHHRTGKRQHQKLLFACWRVGGSPQDIRELYRKRFGIETSYRQWRQARIVTCSRDPRLRLLFIVLGLLLRNLWLWLHATQLAPPDGPRDTDDAFQPDLQRLRFRRLLDWIAGVVGIQLHDLSPPCVCVAT